MPGEVERASHRPQLHERALLPQGVRQGARKAHDLRRVLSRHMESNGIDADALARLPLVDPAGLHPLQGGCPQGRLDRRVRACDRLTQAAACHKRHIKDLVQ